MNQVVPIVLLPGFLFGQNLVGNLDSFPVGFDIIVIVAIGKEQKQDIN